MQAGLIDGICNRSFLVFGRAGMDLFAAPAGTKAELAEGFRADLGGSSANICVGLSKLGMAAALATTLSDDAVGRFCVNRLRHYGVDTSLIRLTNGEYRTSLAVYESTLDDFQNVIYRNNAADFQVTDADVARPDYATYGALITTGTVFAAEPSRSSMFKALDRAKAVGLPIIFDIDYRPYSWPSAAVAAEVLTRAGEASDMIVGNDEEFGFMAGGYEKGQAKARALAADAGRIVIYKKGAQGAITFADREEIATGVYPVTALKPVGSGDSFIAGLLASLARGHSLHEAVLRGSACASIVVSNPGCAPAMPTESALNAFLAAHAGPTSV